MPLLAPTIARQVALEYEQFIDTRSHVPVCLIHNDLGPEHILVDHRTRTPVGIIDFDDTAIGDPVVDLVWLRRVLGAHASSSSKLRLSAAAPRVISPSASEGCFPTRLGRAPHAVA